MQNGATLGGTGTVGALTVQSGGTLAPGTSPGTLHTSNLNLTSGATFTLEFAGTGAGQFDQLAVTGSVTLSGTIPLTLALGTFQPAPGTLFRIIDNDGTEPVSGGGLLSWSGDALSEGGQFTVAGTGFTRTFSISYAGGTGNDVVLTAVIPEIAVFTGASTAAGDERTDNTGTNGFANTAVGSSSAAQTFTLKNIGSANLTGLALTKTGANPGDFTLSAPGATTLAPDATTTFTVTFAPTAGGARSAVVAIASNDGDENPFEINVSGTGVIPLPPVINANSLTMLTNGAFQFTFANTNNATFSVLAATNLSLPAADWTLLGTATNIGGGLYQFTDPGATNYPGRFYWLRFP